MNISPTFNSIHPKGAVEYFINMSNEQTYYIAHNSAAMDKQTRRREKASLGLIKIIPLIDAMVYATPKAASEQLPDLSSLTGKLGKRLAKWGVLLGGFSLLSKGISKLTSKSKKLQSLEENHPVAKSALDLGVLFGGYSIGKKGYEAISKKIPNDITGTLMGNIRKIHKSIDKSKFATNVYTPIAIKTREFLTSNQGLARAGRKIAPYIVPAVTVATMTKVFIIDPILFNRKVGKNYQALRETQEDLKAIIR